ncbi:O-succinylbenzoate-CoA ligase, partial [Listeria monocytogenes FSL F2-208]
EDELRRICQTNLASYKIPKQITIVENLPKTASGKIQRNKLKERHSK